jgi:hypothetical protein
MKDPAINSWLTNSREVIVNLTAIPLALNFHPALVTAGFLLWQRWNL